MPGHGKDFLSVSSGNAKDFLNVSPGNAKDLFVCFYNYIHFPVFVCLTWYFVSAISFPV